MRQNPHVRICGGPGSATTLVYPTPLGEGHLRLIVHEYVEHYQRERNHQGLDDQLLQRPPPPVRADADVQRRERLGGLLSFYYREAA